MEKKLEEIMWVEGFWWNSKEEIVNPKKIGESFIIELTKKFGKETYQNQINKSICEGIDKYFSEFDPMKFEINAYSLGKASEEDFVQYFNCPLTFYKI